MKKDLIKKIYHAMPQPLIAVVMNFYQLRNIFLWPCFIKNYFYFKKISKLSPRFSTRLSDLYPVLGEDTINTGFDRHYIYHPAWAIRRILKSQVVEHVDISSALTFAALLSASLRVKYYDYRPAKIALSDLYCGQANLTVLPFADNEISSLSCMHVVEHVGLGRYGDPIRPDGDLDAINELKRVLAVGGNLYFVVPIGKPKIMFNAHRIYSYDQVVSYFNDLKLVEFALIPRQDDGDLLINPGKKITDDQDYGCGCFWFTK